jgi:hypothetical protein
VHRLQEVRGAAASASLIAMRPAVRNASSELSTLWKLPSVSVTATSTTGKPIGPFIIASRTPCSTAGKYWRGIAPPLIRSSNLKPSPRGSGFSSIGRRRIVRARRIASCAVRAA